MMMPGAAPLPPEMTPGMPPPPAASPIPGLSPTAAFQAPDPNIVQMVMELLSQREAQAKDAVAAERNMLMDMIMQLQGIPADDPMVGVSEGAPMTQAGVPGGAAY